jgi:UDP-2,3-diacylglucosamine pyrophosphatase LpxH
VILGATIERVFVVSDLHLGSPVSDATADLVAFLDHVGATDAGLCINGDGFDLLQGDVASILAASLPVLRRLRELVAAGRPVHYVLGNHDLALEHLLLDLPLAVSPFLNLRSGRSLVRIEHGHVHDPFYARWPGAYELGGRLGRHLLALDKDVYRLWSSAQQRVDRRRRHRERYPHHESARALLARGFDAVVFGHTHLPERTPLEEGLFVNGGDWLTHRTVVEVDRGDVHLAEWTGGRLVPTGP